MNRVVAIIWWFMLIVTTFGVVPLVVVLLRRTLSAAREIEQYTADMLTSGVGVANNTANVAALKDTISVAPQLLGGAESLARYTARIAAALGVKASDDGQAKGKGVQP